VSPHLALLAAYSVAVVAFGLWTSRYVRGSSDFFVAGRSLGPGLILSSMLAANIGAGATVNAAGLAYRDGLSAWWWSGSAGLASFVLAFWVGPRIWALAKEHGFYTTGDFLEHRYGSAVRGIVSVLVTFGCLWIFAAGGLLGTSIVNSFQLVVMLGGFAAALPFVLGHVGGLEAFASPSLPATFNDFTYSAGPGSGWTFLALTGPAFVISPGLIQKSYGAASARALKIGVGLNAVGLMLFAFVPVLLGMAGRVALPAGVAQDLVLPTVLQLLLPTWLGALALAAVFSTEVDTSDAILFMISTSMSKDIYKRYLRPDASDADLLRVARLSAVVGGTLGVLLSIYLSAIVQAMTVFYSLLGVSLFVPVVAGLYSRRGGSAEALGSIAAGVLTLLVVRFGVAGRVPWLDPTLTGLVAAALVYFVILLVRRPRTI
jgi:SSS family solute:Na+ symporter